MSTPKQSQEPFPWLALIVCATIVVLALIAGFVALVRLAPPGTDLVKIIGAVAAGLALVGGQLAGYLKTRKVDGKVTDLSNGLMDAKIRAAVAEVLKPALVDPDIHPQLEADRQRRDSV